MFRRRNSLLGEMPVFVLKFDLETRLSIIYSSSKDFYCVEGSGKCFPLAMCLYISFSFLRVFFFILVQSPTCNQYLDISCGEGILIVFLQPKCALFLVSHFPSFANFNIQTRGIDSPFNIISKDPLICHRTIKLLMFDSSFIILQIRC